MRLEKIEPEFVQYVPEQLAPGVLYVSLEYKVAVHNCACGCGWKTVTPLSRRQGWILSYNGESVSLNPSIGNLQYPCKSHYMITDNQIMWM